MLSILKAIVNEDSEPVNRDVEAGQATYMGRVWSNNSRNNITGALCYLSTFGLTIAGIVCYSAGKASCDNPETECQEGLRVAGKAMLITGTTLLGTICCCGACVLCVGTSALGAIFCCQD